MLQVQINYEELTLQMTLFEDEKSRRWSIGECLEFWISQLSQRFRVQVRYLRSAFPFKCKYGTAKEEPGGAICD